MNWSNRMWVSGGRHAGHPLDWMRLATDERFAQNVLFAHVVVYGFSGGDPDDVQLQELTWPAWELGQ